MADMVATDIRTRDEAGNLTASGFVWSEERAWARQPLLALFLMIGVVEFAVLVLFLATRHEGVLAVLVIIGLVMFGLWRLMALVGQRQRELVFHTDGSMACRLGLPGYGGYRKIPGNHANIASIEARPDVGDHWVEIYSVVGDTTVIAHNLADWQARKVAVCLSNALSDLRESMTTMNRASTPAAGTRQGRRPAAMVID